MVLALILPRASLRALIRSAKMLQLVLVFLLLAAGCVTTSPEERCADRLDGPAGAYDGCLARVQMEREQESQRAAARSDRDDCALAVTFSRASASAGTLDGRHSESSLPEYCRSVSDSEQPMCGNGDCTLRVDRLGRDYCTCKGRRGRAALSCCGI